jgi:subtilisin family serine protease
MEKVVPSLLEPAPSEQREFFLYLREQADLACAADLQSRAEKGSLVVNALREVASRTQPPVLAALAADGLRGESYWIVNAILVTGDETAIERLARRDDVARIYGNPAGRLVDLSTSISSPRDATLPTIATNLTQIHAPEVWALGATGAGVVVGILDSGVDWDHPALKSQYRGWDGVAADHAYNWHDVAGEHPAEPLDGHGHGTAVMGTLVGDDGGANQIGVAPGARWIACRITNDALGFSLAWYLAGLEWMAAPTDLQGLNPDTSKAPDILNNSWECLPDEGCGDPLILQPAVESLRAAGIFLVGVAGNYGPTCSSIAYPPSIYEGMFTVGAVSALDEIAAYSGRGPVTRDGSNRLKPNVTAPTPERSSWTGGGYANGLFATSWSAPHAGGVAALLIDADADLAGNVDALEYLIEQSALPRTTTQDCGDVSGDEVPNNTYGWGRLDALAAYELAMVTGVHESEPDFGLRLAPNVPNPFNPKTIIRCAVPEPGVVVLAIYDLAGRLVRTLASEQRPAGDFEVEWDGRDGRGYNLPSGVYLCRLEACGMVRHHKLSLLR